jgi:hypothetical protein
MLAMWMQSASGAIVAMLLALKAVTGWGDLQNGPRGHATA